MNNLRKYWRQHLFGHLLPPMLCGYLAMTGDPVAIVVPALQMVRQLAGYWEKQDTVSIDTAWIISGTVAGLALGRFLAHALPGIHPWFLG